MKSLFDKAGAYWVCAECGCIVIEVIDAGDDEAWKEFYRRARVCAQVKPFCFSVLCNDCAPAHSAMHALERL